MNPSGSKYCKVNHHFCIDNKHQCNGLPNCSEMDTSDEDQCKLKKICYKFNFHFDFSKLSNYLSKDKFILKLDVKHYANYNEYESRLSVVQINLKQHYQHVDLHEHCMHVVLLREKIYENESFVSLGFLDFFSFMFQ